MKWMLGTVVFAGAVSMTAHAAFADRSPSAGDDHEVQNEQLQNDPALLQVTPRPVVDLPSPRKRTPPMLGRSRPGPALLDQPPREGQPGLLPDISGPKSPAPAPQEVDSEALLLAARTAPDRSELLQSGQRESVELLGDRQTLVASPFLQGRPVGAPGLARLARDLLPAPKQADGAALLAQTPQPTPPAMVTTSAPEGRPQLLDAAVETASPVLLAGQGPSDTPSLLAGGAGGHTAPDGDNALLLTK